MRSASPQLIALLDANQFVMADLYTLTTALGDVFRYTNYDYPLTIGGNVYAADGIIISRSEVRQAIGIEVDTLNVDVFATEDTQLLDVPFIQLLHNGGLDGARFKLERIFMDASTPTDTSAGAVLLFEGRVSETEFSRNQAQLMVSSDLELLNVQLPRNLYQPACLNTLYDSGCGVNPSLFSTSTTVLTGSTLARIECDIAQPLGYYDQGVIEFLSGVNAGVKRTVRKHVTGAITLSLPLRAVPAVGDAIRLYAGCDKSMQTCAARFSNLLRYRGFPFVPVPETAV